MSLILNALSGLATVVLFIGVVYLTLDALVGRLQFANRRVYGKIAVKTPIFIAIGLIVLFLFFDIYLPY